MNRIMRTGGARRRFALALVACALLFRLLVPAGWMPQAGVHGVTLRWCSEIAGPGAHAEAAALLADALGEAPIKQKPKADQPCAFAASAQALAIVELPRLELPPALYDAPAPIAFAPFPGRGLSAPPPPATGPPLLA